MPFTLKAGQALKGAKGTYTMVLQLNESIWTARTPDNLKVIVKTAPTSRLRREQKILQQFPNQRGIRQFVDWTDEPPCLILENMECDSLRASSQSMLSRSDIKLISKRVLQALSAFHGNAIAHTDVKPDNVLLNFKKDGVGVAEAKLADCGDAWDVGFDIDPRGRRHLIGAAIFRSPEAMLEVRWATPTDIWSFGATLISLLWGKNWHIFKPEKVSADDEEYPLHVLIQQARFFGPFPLSYEDFIDSDQNHVLGAILSHIDDQKSRKPFQLLRDKEVTGDDKDFICRIMRMDPRDRPTADELLRDEWFDVP